jgi:2-oxoglutarate/2-oxoacid ferredoxin oxidoreductase subunit beta
MEKSKPKILTNYLPTWCPGCFNFQIFNGLRMFLEKRIKTEDEKKNWAIVSGIGCHGKIFDGINLNGINTLHGRVLPMCLGMKLANPKLNVIGFSGDGDAYAEGMEHLIHMARYNSNIKYVVHNNKVFALTVGQSTPVSEKGYTDKTNPRGVKLNPLNPIKLMLASGCGFVARVFADSKEFEDVLEKAYNHKGFAFIEVIQPCLIFNPLRGIKEKIYFLTKENHDAHDFKKAMEKAEEFNYDVLTDKTKIPLGIFYQEKKDVFEELV